MRPVGQRLCAGVLCASMMTFGAGVAQAAPAGAKTKLGAPKAGAPKAAPVGPRTPELTGDETGVLPHNTCRKQPRNVKFTITLPKEAELQDLVNWMMTISCQKFIWDPKVRSGKVTILSPEPVTVAEAYAAFYAALEQMGLTVEPSGKYFKIVETAGAEGKNLPVYGPKGRAPNNDRFVTQLYRVKSGSAQDVAGVVGKLKSKQGSVQVVGDLLILTDTGSSVRRLLKILRQVDEAAADGERIYFYQLQYADPEEIADIVREMFEEKAAAKSKKRSKGSKAKTSTPGFSRVLVEERTGTLIIVSSPEDYQVIRRLIAKLDVQLAGTGSDRIHVVRLRNADPEKVAQVLQQLASGAQAQKKGGNKKGGAAKGQGGAAVLFSGDIKVTADPDTRSLVILASQSDFYTLRPVIEQLDAERKSIYIEVYLMELTVGRTIQGGAAGHFGTTFATDGGNALGFVASAPAAGLNSVLPGADLLSGLVGGVLGPNIPGSGQFFGLGRDIPAFGVIIQALQSNNNVNVVAEPHMYTADNQEAEIEVGRNVPTQGNLAFPGGAGGNGGLLPVQGIQREQVTLKVTITPHINDDKTVTLDVEMDDRDIESVDQNLGVTTTERKLKLEQIVARDDQPMVLGGLVRETERETTAQVPGLGSIPLLGWLFKRKRKEKVRTNLLMILVPHILDSPDDVRRIHARRVQERMDFMRSTSFKKRELATNVNYRNKKGLLAAINAEAERMEEEIERVRMIEQELMQQEITGELGMKPRPTDDGSDAAAETTGARKSQINVGKAKPSPRKKKRKK